ncbi:MAG: hypothetical protein J0M24_00805 [Verrucomicrobia bacterium]|nr:hypothetical protein [Verrucomicrobiota bacterium]
MNLETLDPWAQQVLSSLFNGGYQGLLLTLAVALALRWTPGANAATRHAVWFVTLLLVALLPVLHGLRGVGSGSPFAWAMEPPARTLPMEILEPSTIGPAVPSMELTHSPLLISDREPLEPLLESESGATSEENPSFEVHELVGGLSEPATATTSAARAGAVPWRFSLPIGWPVALVTIWWGIAGVRLLALGWQLCRLRSLKRCATQAPAQWQDLFERATVEMELKRPTRLALAADVSTPMVIGLGRPTVVLPAAGFEQVSRDQLLQILRHELGHVVRGDDWMNLIQQFIRAVLFFHPAVGWISRRLTLEREVACDDHVLAASGSPKAYALLLTEFAGRMPGRDFAAAPAAWNHQTQLKERIHMILDSKRNASPRLGGVRLAALTAASLAAAGLALQAAPRISLETDPETGTATTLVTETRVNDVVVDDVTVTDIAPLVVHTEPTVVVTTDGLTTVEGATSLPSSHELVSGPRVKTVLVTPTPPVPPTATTQPTPVAPPAAGEAPPPAGPPGSSLEQRLDRLERLVNQLVGRSAQVKSLSRSYGGITEEQLAKIKVDVERAAHEALSKDDLARLQSRAQIEVQRAQRDVERAQRAQAKIKADGEFGQELERVNVQRRALEVRRKALEQQMDSLEEEMEKLEEMQEKLREKSRSVGSGKPQKNGDSYIQKDSAPGASNGSDANSLKKW